MANPYIMQGIGQGFEKMTNTLMSVALNKQALERQKKQDDLDYKIKSAQLEKLNADTSLLDTERKAKDSLYKYNTMILDDITKKTQTQAQQLNSFARGAQSEASLNQSVLNYAGQDYVIDYSKAASGKIPLTRQSKKNVVDEIDATQTLKDREFLSQPIEQKTPKLKEGVFSSGVNQKTFDYANSINTREDLLNMIYSEKSLSSLGIDTKAIKKLYDKELIELATEGYFE